MKTIDEASEDLRKNLESLRHAYFVALTEMQQPPAEVLSVLLELANAALDKNLHHNGRFQGPNAHGWRNDCDCERCQDWSRVFERHEAAMRKVERACIALRDKMLKTEKDQP